MSIGKHISLEEARKAKKLDRFAKAHETKAAKDAFFGLLDRMTKSQSTSGQTSTGASSEGYSGTQTPPGTSQGASRKRGRASL